jgi:hypothetical protein
MIRSVLAVLAGLVALTIVSFGIEAVANPLLIHLFPAALPDSAALARSLPARLFMLAYTMFAIFVGGYVTAWIASRSKVWHAVVMGIIEVAFTLYVMIAAPFPEVSPSPRWGFIAAMVLTIPAAALGGALRARGRSRNTVAVA